MKNKARALEALAKDCQVKGYYYKNGETCAIGCLALLAGITVERLTIASGTPIIYDANSDIYAAIRRTFGLELEAQERIQRLNDYGDNDNENGDDREACRRAVLRWVELEPERKKARSSREKH